MVGKINILDSFMNSNQSQLFLSLCWVVNLTSKNQPALNIVDLIKSILSIVDFDFDVSTQLLIANDF